MLLLQTSNRNHNSSISEKLCLVFYMSERRIIKEIHVLAKRYNSYLKLSRVALIVNEKL